MPTILIADDDPQIRGWLRYILESKGYEVMEACDGYAALACLERAEPALVVLDLFMPKFDGLEIVLYLRSCSKSVKVLAISGNPVPGFDACVTAKAFGAHEVLTKPFDAEMFLNRVEGVLSRPS